MNAFVRLAAGTVIVALIAGSAGVLGFAGDLHFHQLALFDKIEQGIAGERAPGGSANAAVPPELRRSNSSSFDLGAAPDPLDPAHGPPLP